MYKEERELQHLQADIKAAVEPSEIFANGNLDDSGFDLINDLQIIEKLLFLKSNPIDVGKAYVAEEEEEAAPPVPAAPAPAPGGEEIPSGPVTLPPGAPPRPRHPPGYRECVQTSGGIREESGTHPILLDNLPMHR